MSSRQLLAWLGSGGPSASALRGDAFSELLEQLRLDVWFCGLSKFAPGFGIELPESEGATLFYVDRGSMLVRADDSDEQARAVQAGEAVLVRGRRGFVISEHESCDIKLVDDVVPPEYVREHRGLRQGDDGHVCETVIAAVRFRDGRSAELLQGLPTVTGGPINRVAGAPGIVQALLELCEPNTGFLTEGAHAIPARLVQTLCLQMIHAELTASPEAGTSGLLAIAALDPDIGGALSLMLSTPARDWTLQSLALEAGMSRSVFAERFREVVGHTPMEFLRRLRLETARDLLLTTNDSVATIAEQVGYGSSGAFCTAFRKTFGTSPGGYRAGR